MILKNTQEDRILKIFYPKTDFLVGEIVYYSFLKFHPLAQSF